MRTLTQNCTGRSKLPQPMLFDVQADPHETKTVATTHPEIVEKMVRTIRRMVETGTAQRQ